MSFKAPSTRDSLNLSSYDEADSLGLPKFVIKCLIIITICPFCWFESVFSYVVRKPVYKVEISLDAAPVLVALILLFLLSYLLTGLTLSGSFFFWLAK